MTGVGSFRRVLVGFDGSPDATEAMRAATAVAARDGGHVVALCVVRQPPHADGDHEGNEASGRLRQHAEAVFEELRRDQPSVPGVRTSVKVVYADRDDPGRVVTDYAAQHGFDMLVLGRHGDGARRKKLGRVADAAIEASGVPVLLLSAR